MHTGIGLATAKRLLKAAKDSEILLTVTSTMRRTDSPLLLTVYSLPPKKIRLY